MMDDSLFGSPPASPVRGRSPELALPTGLSEGIGNDLQTQNVGTIALPGSQHFSELPMNPLALSMSFPTLGPPAQTSHATRAHSASAKLHETPNSSRASSAGPSQKRARAKKIAPSFRRPTPPPIPLPDPSEPPPPNFLRNSSALLGTAGVVSGLKHCNLSHRDTRGHSAMNPIVVDPQASQRPASNRPAISLTPRTNRPPLPPGLRAPSDTNIVTVLVEQGEIFQVLADISKVVGKALPRQKTAFERSSSPATAPAESPVKRRKLNRVPAGAGDWDVPYPFQAGEGPDKYSLTWQRERLKGLIAQLEDLVRRATRVAAAREHMQEQEQLTLSECHPKGPPFVDSNCFQGRYDIGSNGFDHIFSIVNQTAPYSQPSSSTPLVDDTTFDQWMSIFQSAPSPSSVPSFIPNSQPLDIDTMMLDPETVAFLSSEFAAPFAANSRDLVEGVAMDGKSRSEFANSTEPPASIDISSISDPLGLAPPSFPPFEPPELHVNTQDISNQPSMPSSLSNGSMFSNNWDILPSLAGSPIPSMSSYGDMPGTPTMANWDLQLGGFPTVLEPIIESSVFNPVDSILNRGTPEIDVQMLDYQSEKVANALPVEGQPLLDDFGVEPVFAVTPDTTTTAPLPATEPPVEPSVLQTADECDDRPTWVSSGVPTSAAALISSVLHKTRSVPADPAPVQPSTSIPPPLPRQVRAAPDRAARKKLVLAQAKATRTALAAALVAATTELWETTIEQGVLAQMARHH